MHTFFLSPAEWVYPIIIKRDEFRHLHQVLRLRCGDVVQILDGQGRLAVCEIAKIENKSAELKIIRETKEPRKNNGVTLAIGWGKETRRSWIFEKSAELQADALWFWQAERSQFPLPEEEKTTWTASLIAGLKQSQNLWLPEIRTFPKGIQSVIETSKTFACRHILVTPEWENSTYLTENLLAQEGKTLCIIGPEGGMTKEEVSLCVRRGFTAVNMGNSVLRWETAAMLALGLHWWARGKNSEL